MRTSLPAAPMRGRSLLLITGALLLAGLAPVAFRPRDTSLSRLQDPLPPARVAQALLVRAGNPHRLHAYADADAIQRGAIRVAVLQRSFEETLLRSNGMPAERLLPVPDAASGRAAVESGRADALALSAPTLRWMAGGRPTSDSQLAEPFEQPGAVPDGHGRAAFAFRRGDRALAEAWDRKLRAWLGSDECRTLWTQFGFAASELPTSREAKIPTP